ncbi:MAG: hypothetical protein IID44_18655 [Planctomycetes bacterium]|nr:hypothetical protein [Planctomycetota bacterium]
MVAKFQIPLRIVLYQEGGEWIAHCLEFDLVGNGATRQDAIASLSQAIRIQVEESIDLNNPRNLFDPADGEYFHMFAKGKDIADARLTLEIEGVDAEGTSCREYEHAGA